MVFLNTAKQRGGRERERRRRRYNDGCPPDAAFWRGRGGFSLEIPPPSSHLMNKYYVRENLTHGKERRRGEKIESHSLRSAAAENNNNAKQQNHDSGDDITANPNWETEPVIIMT